jgi:hypothetical protein
MISWNPRRAIATSTVKASRVDLVGSNMFFWPLCSWMWEKMTVGHEPWSILELYIYITTKENKHTISCGSMRSTTNNNMLTFSVMVS